MKAVGNFFLVFSLFVGVTMEVSGQTSATYDQLEYRQFQKGLEKRIKFFNGEGKSLKEIVTELSIAGGFAINIHPKVEEVFGPDGMTFTLSRSNVRVKSILDHILRISELYGDYQDGVLYITTAEEELDVQEIVSRTYNISSILLIPSQPIPVPGSGGPSVRQVSRKAKQEISPVGIARKGNELIDFITKTIAKRTWETDPRVSIKYDPLTASISVGHTSAVQYQINSLINSLGDSLRR